MLHGTSANSCPSCGHGVPSQQAARGGRQCSAEDWLTRGCPWDAHEPLARNVVQNSSSCVCVMGGGGGRLGHGFVPQAASELEVGPGQRASRSGGPAPHTMGGWGGGSTLMLTLTPGRGGGGGASALEGG